MVCVWREEECQRTNQDSGNSGRDAQTKEQPGIGEKSQRTEHDRNVRTDLPILEPVMLVFGQFGCGTVRFGFSLDPLAFPFVFHVFRFQARLGLLNEFALTVSEGPGQCEIGVLNFDLVYISALAFCLVPRKAIGGLYLFHDHLIGLVVCECGNQRHHYRECRDEDAYAFMFLFLHVMGHSDF
jgi:hypothetical protein